MRHSVDFYRSQWKHKIFTSQQARFTHCLILKNEIKTYYCAKYFYTNIIYFRETFHYIVIFISPTLFSPMAFSGSEKDWHLMNLIVVAATRTSTRCWTGDRAGARPPSWRAPWRGCWWSTRRCGARRWAATSCPRRSCAPPRTASTSRRRTGTPITPCWSNFRTFDEFRLRFWLTRYLHLGGKYRFDIYILCLFDIDL